MAKISLLVQVFHAYFQFKMSRQVELFCVEQSISKAEGFTNYKEMFSHKLSVFIDSIRKHLVEDVPLFRWTNDCNGTLSFTG